MEDTSQEETKEGECVCVCAQIIAPNGACYVPPSVRVGVLPRMLREILDTRILAKSSMKKYAADRVSVGSHTRRRKHNTEAHCLSLSHTNTQHTHKTHTRTYAHAGARMVLVVPLISCLPLVPAGAPAYSQRASVRSQND